MSTLARIVMASGLSSITTQPKPVGFIGKENVPIAVIAPANNMKTFLLDAKTERLIDKLVHEVPWELNLTTAQKDYLKNVLRLCYLYGAKDGYAAQYKFTHQVLEDRRAS